MKRILKRTLSALLCLAQLVSLCLFALPASAEEAPTAESAITYIGISARLSDKGAIRSVWEVDPDVIDALEADYDVAYGVIAGVADVDGRAYLCPRDLAVEGSHEAGYVATEDAATALTVYASGVTDGTAALYINEERTAFACAVSAEDATLAEYGVGYAFAAYLALTSKADGTVTYYYDYAEGEAFGKASATYGDGVSIAEAADYFVNRYEGSFSKKLSYNESPLLRAVLTNTGRNIRTLAVTRVTPEETPLVSISHAQVDRFLNYARLDYCSEEYADYTTSLISDYVTADTRHEYLDRPLPLLLTWDGAEGEEYTVYLSASESFPESATRTFTVTEPALEVYNLYAGTDYYWRVEAAGEAVVECASFRTKATVRYIYAEGARNVRDVGGWNDLNQGLLYRGSELNLSDGHGLELTEAGRAVLRDELGIRTELDFRAANSAGGITASPIGDGVQYLRVTLSGYTALYTSSAYATVFRTLAEYENYPVYMHCWGGADRTGTVAFMLEGLCGVYEEDLAIDFELTSFSDFGMRYRYDFTDDTTSYLYASLLAEMKKYPGETLEEKFISCASTTLKLTAAQISNIRAIHTGSSAVFTKDSLGNVYYDHSADSDITLAFHMRGATDVSSVTVGDTALPFTFDAESATLTVSGAGIEAAGILHDVVTVTFNDGGTLAFTLSTSLAEELIGDIVKNGEYRHLFTEATDISNDGSTVTVTDEDGAFLIPANLVNALANLGYETLLFTVSKSGTVMVKNADGRNALILTLSAGDEVSVPLTNGGDVRFSFGVGTVTLTEMRAINADMLWLDRIADGDWTALHAGTMQEDGSIMTAQGGNNVAFLSAETVQKLLSLGYTKVTFTVEAQVASNAMNPATEYLFLALRVYDSGGKYTKDDSGVSDDSTTVRATYTVPLTGGDVRIILRKNLDGKATTDSYTAISGVVYVCFSDISISE